VGGCCNGTPAAAWMRTGTAMGTAIMNTGRSMK